MVKEANNCMDMGKGGRGPVGLQAALRLIYPYQFLRSIV
jgi:hypothetical protein